MNAKRKDLVDFDALVGVFVRSVVLITPFCEQPAKNKATRAHAAKNCLLAKRIVSPVPYVNDLIAISVSPFLPRLALIRLSG
jgi:hypothetical protein